MAKQSYSLFELNQYIRQVMALNFEDAIWINCEIAQINERRGNVYLDLVEQDDDDNVIAQSSAAIWYSNYIFIKNKLGQLANTILADGSHVLLKVRVDYNERYGLKLIVEDIDPAYSIGKLEMARQKIIERLKTEDVINLNQSKVLPLVIQRIAVISAQNAAGYQDFLKQCADNPYGYKFKITLFNAAMQGNNTEREVCNALEIISSQADQYDAIAIMRGGGSKLDLSGFDNFNIGHKIATAPLPVITGIGHEIDSSVADIVANTSLKTPTAVADFLIDRMLYFESDIANSVQLIAKYSIEKIRYQQLSLESMSQLLAQYPISIIANNRSKVDLITQRIIEAGRNAIHVSNYNLLKTISNIEAYDPKAIMAKGYSLVTQNDKIIKRRDQLTKDVFNVVFTDGEVKAQKI